MSEFQVVPTMFEAIEHFVRGHKTIVPRELQEAFCTLTYGAALSYMDDLTHVYKNITWVNDYTIEIG